MAGIVPDHCSTPEEWIAEIERTAKAKLAGLRHHCEVNGPDEREIRKTLVWVRSDLGRIETIKECRALGEQIRKARGQ